MFGLVGVLLAGTALAAQETMSPAQVLDRLEAGNASFATNPEGFLPIDIEGRSRLVDGQSPYAAVLSCADSRVPPEIVFHAGLGELFVVRSAGHVADRSVLASLEYAAEHLHVPLIVVMGHESCGAVTAAMETPPTVSLGANLDYMVKAIRPAVAAAAATPEATRLRVAILQHVEDTINTLIDDSPILRRLAEDGSVAFVGAYYELSTGRAHFSQLALVSPAPAGSPAHP